ncbi:MAG: DUF4956 domain-containing protein [Ruminococcaceae bacterium]|nr:DUF4956 domain-containing protein [Oscillospiraceae bacterium]
MFENIFRGIFDTDTATVIGIKDFVICISVALALGAIIALAYMYRTRYTRSFLVTLAILPSVVCVVIMMVNGNVGTGVAVAGAFSLVRFRSAPGTAKEIGTLFLAMTSGLMCGMGYLGYAVLFTLLICIVFVLYSRFNFGTGKGNEAYKSFRITIPEDLDYTGVFDEVFKDYCHETELTMVKSVNMGSMFRLTYDVVLKDPAKEKELIDLLRCRNGNLEITVSKQSMEKVEL